MCSSDLAQRALERLAGEILGKRRIAREDEQVSKDVVEMLLGNRSEARRPRARSSSRGQSRRSGVHVFHTAPPTVWSHRLAEENRRCRASIFFGIERGERLKLAAPGEPRRGARLVAARGA